MSSRPQCPSQPTDGSYTPKSASSTAARTDGTSTENIRTMDPAGTDALAFRCRRVGLDRIWPLPHPSIPISIYLLGAMIVRYQQRHRQLPQYRNLPRYPISRDFFCWWRVRRVRLRCINIVRTSTASPIVSYPSLRPSSNPSRLPQTAVSN